MVGKVPKLANDNTCCNVALSDDCHSDL